MRRLKKIFIGLLLAIAVFVFYALYNNRNSVNMSARQKILKTIYPAVMWFSKLSKSNAEILENETANAPVPFYSLKTLNGYGDLFDFSILKGKKVLIINTASDCGFTDQYTELEKLYRQYKGQLEIIAFPANDFKQQEKGTDKEIVAFCKKNYAVTFPIMSKSIVVDSAGQNPVFKWLTHSSFNGWNSKAPSWNFSKYLVNEKGQLTNYFGPGISPLSEAVKKAIEKNDP